MIGVLVAQSLRLYRALLQTTKTSKTQELPAQIKH